MCRPVLKAKLLTRSGKTEVPDSVRVYAVAVWAGTVAVGGHEAEVEAGDGRGGAVTEVAVAALRDAHAEAPLRRGLLHDEVLDLAAPLAIRLSPTAVTGKAWRGKKSCGNVPRILPLPAARCAGLHGGLHG